MSDQPKCETCKFYDPNNHAGVCRKDPPKVAQSGARWPDVRGTDWCGEHRVKAKAKASK